MSYNILKEMSESAVAATTLLASTVPLLQERLSSRGEVGRGGGCRELPTCKHNNFSFTTRTDYITSFPPRVKKKHEIFFDPLIWMNISSTLVALRALVSMKMASMSCAYWAPLCRDICRVGGWGGGGGGGWGEKEGMKGEDRWRKAEKKEKGRKD